jgi:hypothetical protein
VTGGSFAASDHEYPSHLELKLTVTDSSGLQDVASVRLDPQTVNLTFQSSPSGVTLGFATGSGVTPFARTVIVGSTTSVSAPSPIQVGGRKPPDHRRSLAGDLHRHLPPSALTRRRWLTPALTPPSPSTSPGRGGDSNPWQPRARSPRPVDPEI